MLLMRTRAATCPGGASLSDFTHLTEENTMSRFGATPGQLLRLLLLAVLLCSSLPLIAPPASVAATSQEGTPSEDAPADLSAVDLVAQVLPGVVAIMAYTPTDDEDEGQMYSIGSGFVMDEDGHIITNWHVVTGSEIYYVTFSNGVYVEAELVGLDPRDDIAVLEVDPDVIPAVLPMGDSDAVVPGQSVIAIGSPSGITNTVTEGIASGSGRTGADPGLYAQGQCQNYNNLIQHSAAINQGNSGGPLFNMQGEVIGINTISVTNTSGTDLAGIYYAVPSNTIRKVAADLIEDGELSVPVMGVESLPITIPTAIFYDLPFANGVLVTAVANNSPADRAGFEEGDILLSIDDQDITKDDTLSEILFDYSPGDTIEISYIDGQTGDEETADLRLAEVSQSTLESCELTGE
jgi:S1-C subfamily serine protease